MSDEIILHHYWPSPYSEKVRLALGLKGVSWKSVITPDRLPKPDLIPLTGGYRRAPVMQIGADIYCDSQLMLEEIERRHPTPSLYPTSDRATARGFALWADRILFQPAVALIFGALGDAVDESFKKDREAMSGRPFDPDGMKAAIPMMRDQFRAGVGWIGDQLADGRPFLMGEAAGAADIHAYMNLWFTKNVIAHELGFLDDLPGLNDWYDRVSAIGHGDHQEISGEAALAIARETESPTNHADGSDLNGRKLGDRVAVMPDDYGRDPVAGELVLLTADEVAVAREDDAVGRVVVHFPRQGFVVVPA